MGACLVRREVHVTPSHTGGLLVFVLQFTGRGRLITRSRVAVVLVVPVITMVMVWTNGAAVCGSARCRLLAGGSFLVAAEIAPVLVHGALRCMAMPFFLFGAVLLSSWRPSARFVCNRSQAVLIALGSLVVTLGSMIPTFDLMPSARFNPLTQKVLPWVLSS